MHLEVRQHTDTDNARNTDDALREAGLSCFTHNLNLTEIFIDFYIFELS